MKIHKCYFCNYSTKYSTSFKDHIMKKNKCNYLIKSVSINSIEDYCKLVELHQKDPTNTIFNENPEDSPPIYYDSDNSENTDEEKQDKINKNTEFINKQIDNYLNPKFECEYCCQTFTRKDALNRHINKRCKVLKQIKQQEYQQEAENKKYNETMKQLEDKDLVEEIMLLKGLMEQQDEKNRTMAEKIQQLENKPTNSIITNNNNIQNIEKQENIQNKTEITINNFGDENKDIFKDEDYMMSWIDRPFKAMPHMIEKLHFCPKTRPENTNIRINNISNGKSQIYKYGKWKTIMKHELIYDLITECANKLIDTYELYVQEGKIKRMTRFEKFMRQYEQDDAYFVKTQSEQIDCKLIDCVKKHKTYLNSLK